MKYFKTWKDTGNRHEITYDEALDSILRCYTDTPEVRDLLNHPQTINCMFSYLEIEED